MPRRASLSFVLPLVVLKYKATSREVNERLSPRLSRSEYSFRPAPSTPAHGGQGERLVPPYTRGSVYDDDDDDDDEYNGGGDGGKGGNGPSRGHPCSRAHFHTSSCPPAAVNSHVSSSHGQSCSRAHLSTSRCPPLSGLITHLDVPSRCRDYTKGYIINTLHRPEF